MESNPRIAEFCPHPYYWLAIFEDDEKVAQYTEDGKEVLYREVLNRLESGKRLSSISWIPINSKRSSYTQFIDSSWQRPIILRRHIKKVGLFFGGQSDIVTTFLLGWQATINRKNYKSVLFIDSITGNIEVRSDL